MNNNFRLNIDGIKLRGVIENPGQEKIIILVHGFTGDKRGPDNLFIKLSEALQKEGYSVCRFDCRGSFESDGVFQDMTVASEVEDLEAVLEYVKGEGYKHISLLGESMGGTIIGSLSDFSGFANIIFWYSAFAFNGTDFDNYFSAENRSLLSTQGYLQEAGYKVGKEFIRQIPEINISNNLKNILCPVYLLHGDSDRDVPVGQSEKAFKIIGTKNTQLEIIQGAEHCFKNEQEEAVEKTLNFLKKYE